MHSNGMIHADYHLLDVFTGAPFSGNQLAVFPEGGSLDPALMQRIANELNIAESVFATRLHDDPSRPARLRIFTPGREVPFAGHPTIGTAIAVSEILRWTDRDAFIFEEQVGDVHVRLERGSGASTAWLVTPPIAFGESFDPVACAAMLGLDVEQLDARFVPRSAGAGSMFLYVGVRDAATVDAAQLDARALTALAGRGTVVGTMIFAQREGGTYVRMFAPEAGIVEDPATGSAAGPLYACLVDDGLLSHNDASYVSEQGTAMGRRSILHVRVVRRDGTLQFEVGGNAVRVGSGRLELPD